LGVVDIQVSAGQFYTLVVSDGAPSASLMVDTPNANLSRAQLTLYNLSDASAVALKLADGSAAVIEGVAPGEQASRLVNPISVDLGVWVGNERVKTLASHELVRGSAYSVFVWGGADGYQASWVQNATKTR
jgi:hypothetical protein